MPTVTRGWLVLTAAVSLVAGCHKPPETPEQVYQKLERAIAAGDAGTFYDCLDQKTKKSIEGTWRTQQLERTIISGKYPEAEAGPALARLEAAAADSPRAYFVKLAGERHTVEGYRKRIGSVSGPIKTKPDGDQAIWVARQDGMPVHFVKDEGGSWRFPELGVEWALEEDKASHAVQTVRENAALYEKAAH